MAIVLKFFFYLFLYELTLIEFFSQISSNLHRTEFKYGYLYVYGLLKPLEAIVFVCGMSSDKIFFKCVPFNIDKIRKVNFTIPFICGYQLDVFIECV